MSVPTGTLVRSSFVGEREDLEDTIYRVAQEDRPVTSMIGKRKVKSVLHEWQIDTLAARDPDNAAYEGDDVSSFDTNTQPTRVGVFCQIFENNGSISGTAMEADLAGRETELARQKTKKGLELLNDMEARLVANKASVAETPASVTRKTAGLQAWIATNDTFGLGGSSGGWSSGGVVAAATAGTNRTLTEALLKGVLVTGYTNGARYKAVFFSGTHKQQASGFTGIADIRVAANPAQQATIVAGADRYMSDFGALDFYPHPDLTDAVLGINPEFFAIGTYRGVQTKMLASNGDNIKWQTLAEKCFMALNEKQGFVIRALS
jgi:hypothetical protein